MKTSLCLAVLLAALFLFPTKSSAQFGESATFLGPHIGLGAYQSSPTFGAYFDKAINKPGELGDGVLSISGRLDYTSFDWSSYDNYTWTLISVGVYCNYHFRFGDGKFDPFLGLGLGYHNWSHSYDGPGEDLWSDNWNSGVYFDANAGARYFFSPALALRASLGFGTAFFVVGIDFGL